MIVVGKKKGLDENVSMEMAKEFYACIESHQYPNDILFLAAKRACCPLGKNRSWGIGQGEFYHEPSQCDIIQTIYNEINEITSVGYSEYDEPLAALIRGRAWRKAAQLKDEDPPSVYEKNISEITRTVNDFRKCKDELVEKMKEGLSYHEAEKASYPRTEEGYVENMLFIDGHEINPFQFYALIKYLDKGEQKKILERIEKKRPIIENEDYCNFCDYNCDESLIKKAFSQKELFEIAEKIGSKRGVVKHLPPGEYEKAKETFFDLLKDYMYGVWTREERNAYKLSSDSKWF